MHLTGWVRSNASSGESASPGAAYSACRSRSRLTRGEIERREFKTMSGLGDRTAVSALSALLKRGLLKSDAPQGKVRFALPLHALRFYFPAL